jgi:hypothetical protein
MQGTPRERPCCVPGVIGAGSLMGTLDQMVRIVTFLWLVLGLAACRTPERVTDASQGSEAPERITDGRQASEAPGRTLPHTFPREHGGEPSFEPMTRRALSTEEASTLAARLANEQCERRYRRRPFKPEQYPAILLDGVYHWGKLDVGGHAGFSASVIFYPDGSEPHVEVYFSSDTTLGLR